MQVHRSYPFVLQTALFFVQELVENVLEDFGVYWEVQRSEREKQLRAVATYVYTPEVGKLVTHFSRTYGSVVVRKCLNTWKYITFHRKSVWEELLFNSVTNLCERSNLEKSDTAIIVFLAIVVDQARLVKLEEKDYLVETIIRALSYCMINLIPGGFINTLNRLRRYSSEYIYPSGEYNDLLATILTSTQATKFQDTCMDNELYTPSRFNDPLWKATIQEIKEHLEKREAIRQFAERKRSKTKKTLAIKNVICDSRTDISKKDVDVGSPKRHLATLTQISSESCDSATQTPTSFGSYDAETQTPTSSGNCDIATQTQTSSGNSDSATQTETTSRNYDSMNQIASLKDDIDSLSSSNDNDCVESQVGNIDLNAGSKSLSTTIELPTKVSKVNAGDQF